MKFRMKQIKRVYGDLHRRSFSLLTRLLCAVLVASVVFGEIAMPVELSIGRKYYQSSFAISAPYFAVPESDASESLVSDELWDCADLVLSALVDKNPAALSSIQLLTQDGDAVSVDSVDFFRIPLGGARHAELAGCFKFGNLYVFIARPEPRELAKDSLVPIPLLINDGTPHLAYEWIMSYPLATSFVSAARTIPEGRLLKAEGRKYAVNLPANSPMGDLSDVSIVFDGVFPEDGVHIITDGTVVASEAGGNGTDQNLADVLNYYRTYIRDLLAVPLDENL